MSNMLSIIRVTTALIMAAFSISALADSFSGGTAGSFNPNSNISFGGNNTATGFSSVTPSTSECGATITPAHNVIQCTLSANATMALPSSFTPYQPITYVLTENGTGGFTVTACTACEFPASQLSGSAVAISTTAGAENEISCDTTAISSTNKMHCTVVAGFTAPTSFSVGTGIEGSNPGQNETSVTITGVVITSGDYLLVAHFSCGGGSNCAAATPTAPTGVTVSGGTGAIGSCALLSGITLSSSPAGIIPASGIEICPVTTSGTATLTVSMAASDYPHDFAFDVHGLSATVDEGVGNIASGSSSAMPSVATNGTPTQATNFIVASFGGGGNPTSGAGYTTIGSDSGNNLLVEWQSSTSPSGNVTATANQAASAYYAMIGALK